MERKIKYDPPSWSLPSLSTPKGIFQMSLNWYSLPPGGGGGGVSMSLIISEINHHLHEIWHILITMSAVFLIQK